MVIDLAPPAVTSASLDARAERVAHLSRIAGQRLIVTGSDALSSVRDTGLFKEEWVVGKFDGRDIVVADKRPSGEERHGHDIGPVRLRAAAEIVPRPDLLRYLVDISRETLGFFTVHFTRCEEYTWLAEKLEEPVAGFQIADIGAGLSPTPIFAAERGATVHCVDYSPHIRTVDNQAQWNEWGFIDYSRFHPNLHAYNMDVLAYRPEHPLDVLYSISVVEHFPRTGWEQFLNLAKKWIKPGGRLLLTIDLDSGNGLVVEFGGG